ncbi:DJ-1/PfpI family protein [Parafrankia sp. FMc6]|uniref:DJ-1/PfpI family protein n=1 Tax=Parafrankia soli TaxID=2599596 RepID=UPI0034D5570B
MEAVPPQDPRRGKALGAPVPDARLTAPLDEPASGSITVAFLISSDAQVIDFAGPWGVFEYVQVGDDRRRPFALYTVAATTAPVQVSGGMTIVPNHDVDTAPAPDIVVVPAMNLETLAPEALAWLHRVHERTAVTMSVCDGSFVLAQAGLLHGATATAHHHSYSALRAMFPDVDVVRGLRYIESGRTATSGGLTSGIDLALRVVERYHGRAIAQQTAAFLEYQGTGWMHPTSNSEFTDRPNSTPQHPLCPVCEMAIPVDTALTREHEGITWHLCGKWCADHFDATPARFIIR